jgi:hypothetical protein
MQYKEPPFSQLRHAYTTVKLFIEDETGCEIDSLHNKIEAHLGIAGDDTEELLRKFINQFDLSAEGFEFDKHFYSEGELFGSSYALYNLVVMFIKVSMWLIEMISFKLIRFHNKPQWYRPLDREVSDLTFKQMLTWYIEKTLQLLSRLHTGLLLVLTYKRLCIKASKCLPSYI